MFEAIHQQIINFVRGCNTSDAICVKCLLEILNCRLFYIMNIIKGKTSPIIILL